MAYVLATGFDNYTTEREIEKELTYNIQRKTNKIYYVKAEREPNWHNNYQNFRISCKCVNSEIFMDSSIWPENIKVRWYSSKRRNQEGQKYPQHM